MTEKNQINLWNIALLDAAQQSPFDFMREQGDVLKEQTNGLLWGEVTPYIGEDMITYHGFQIASRQLGEYRCLLLSTAYANHIFPLYIYDYSRSNDALKSYKYVTQDMLLQEWAKTLNNPILQIESEQGRFFAPPPNYIAEDFNEFKKVFATILESSGTRAIVQSLLLQSRRPADF